MPLKVRSPKTIITVLVTEDSETIAHALMLILNSDPKVEVVGWAKNGEECLRMVAKLRPDIVTMDIEMPLLDGIETTRAILKEHPVPILIVSSTIKGDLKKTFDALQAGAFDVIERPRLTDGDTDRQLRKVLLTKVKKIATKFISLSPGYLPHKQTCLSPVYQDTPTPEGCDKIILIGASTGGPPALNFILSNLPKNMPFPLLIVQHIEEGFTHGLVNWLQQNSKLQVRVAQDYESISKGVVYFPPDNSFMGIAQSGRISLNPLLKNQAHTHTIDFLMTSASEVFNNSCIGILLTGMGNDGARGMKTIRDRGGRTIAQDEESSLIFGMPQKAIKNNGADKISPLKQIPQEIMSFCTPTLDQRVS